MQRVRDRVLILHDDMDHAKTAVRAKQQKEAGL